MNQIPAYQHPFVDVFNVFKLTEWKTCHKEGDVTEVFDKEIAKQVIQIGGATQASNYIAVPATKNLPKQSLGLIGRYLYVLLNAPLGKTFVMHFDYMINDSRVVRVSVSNLYKEFSNKSSSLQVPLSIGGSFIAGKWTVFVLNVLHLFEENKVFAAGQQQKFFLRSFQILANVSLRGVFTSELAYTPTTLPKALEFRLPKDKDWFAAYNWMQIPNVEFEQVKENKALNGEKELATKSNLKTAGTETAKKVSFGGPTGGRGKKKQQAPQVVQDQEPVQEKLAEMDIATEMRLASEKATAEYQEKKAEFDEERNSNVQKTLREVEKIKQEYDLSLKSKHIKPEAEMTLYRDEGLYDPNKSQRQNCEKFILKPDPIVGLDRIIGVHPRFNSGAVFFNKDPKLSSEIIFSQANVLLGLHAQLQKQRLFSEESSKQSIVKLLVVHGYACSFTIEPSVAKQKSATQEDVMCTIWDLDQTRKSLFKFKIPISKLKSVCINNDQSALCINGRDFQGRELVLVYALNEIIKFQKVELLARQICDIELTHLRFNDVLHSQLVGCARENVRFFKIKNNFLPSQLVALNNTGRGKVFNNSTTAFKVDEQKGTRKVTQIFVSTDCGLLYLINFASRQVDKIIQIHNDPVRCLQMAPIALTGGEQTSFYFTCSQTGQLRLWSLDFSKIISEVQVDQDITHADISSTNKEIAVLSAEGTLSLLELEASTFRVLMRSHMADVAGLVHNELSGSLISIGNDSSIKVWNAENMEQIHEFNTSSHDPPLSIATSHTDAVFAVGFKSGFIRLFNLIDRVLTCELMVFDSSLMDIQFSSNNKFIACFYRNNKIVILNNEKGSEPIPVKNIDYEFPNANYFSLSFSPDGSMLANISSNANTVTVWETKNFSLKWLIDLTGDVISKIAFSPNGKDLLVMTTSAKLQVLRCDPQKPDSVPTVREQYGMTDKQCSDFLITPNGKFIIAAGKEGAIKVYDYFLRGEICAAQQTFTGHLEYASCLTLQKDMRFLYSTGPGNGIYKWAFYGDKDIPSDLTQQFEKLPEDLNKIIEKSKNVQHPLFDQEDLSSYTEKQIAEMRAKIVSDKLTNTNHPFNAATASSEIPRPHQELLTDGGISLKRRPKIEYTPNGYVFEKHEIAIKKVLGCSITPKARNNIAWSQKHRFIAYSMQNILIFEELNAEKTQSLKNDVNDSIKEVKLSPNGDLLLVFTRDGRLDGFPQIIVYNTLTRRKVSQITIDDQEIVAVEFSNYSNMLLVVSYNGNDTNPRSTIAVWDFLDGRREYLSKSVVPFLVYDARWNPYIKTSSDEFVTISDQKYQYWRITRNLTMEYQDGQRPNGAFQVDAKNARFTSLSFVEPMLEQNSVYLLLGLSDGNVWVLDTKTNHFVSSTKILDCAVSKMVSSVARIVVEGATDTHLRAWELKKTISDFDYDASDPGYFFAGPEKKLKLDGYPSATAYDPTAAETIAISTNGSFWLLNFLEEETVKLKSCHNPSKAINAVDFKYVSPNQFCPSQQQSGSLYEFDQNYLVGSCGRDGAIKVWNLHDLDHVMNLTLPKEECVAVAMHQYKPYMICSFTDGYLRFFDLDSTKNLGRCLINVAQEDEQSINGNDFATCIKILPSGNHLMCATKNGQVLLIFVESWHPLAISIQNLVSVNTSTFGFDVSFLEPYNKWLLSTCNGKVLVYNRQDGNSFKQEIFEQRNPPVFTFMDSFNVQEYVDNCFTEAKKVNTLDHFYSLAKRNLVHNEKSFEHETEAVFLNNDLATYICYVRKCNSLFLRNFELHQVVKKIDFQAMCLKMEIAPGTSPYVFLAHADNSIKMVDFVNETNETRIETIHDELRLMKVCPNGRYILTAGDKGDIIVYSVRRQAPPHVPH